MCQVYKILYWYNYFHGVAFATSKLLYCLCTRNGKTIGALDIPKTINLKEGFHVVLFSSPEPKAQVSYCHSAPSVVRPSVRPSVVVVRKLSHFNFFSETALPNSTKLDRTQDLNVLYQVCVFRADRKNKMAAPASDWLRHFQLLL